MSIFRAASAPAVTPQYTGLQLQTASSALPIPIVYGVAQIAPNLIWSADFQTVPQYGTTPGGKGGGQPSVSGYDYTTALIFGLAEGPIVGVGRIFESSSYYDGTHTSYAVFTGTTPQTSWGYLTANHPNAALAYQGTAYVATGTYNLGSSASFGSIAFELHGRLAANAPVNGMDADPALVVADFLTNAQYGVGFPAASLDATSLYGASGDGTYQTYCQAMGLGLSPSLSDQETAATTLARWLQLTNATAVWSDGRLKVMPLGDAPATGTIASGANVTFQPNTTPVMALDDDDFVSDGNADPVLVARIDTYAAPNLQRIEILDRANRYSPTPVEARDQNAIELFGLVIGSTITAHDICDLGIAAVSAQLILQRGLYVRNTYSFRLSWDYCLLEPMDIVTLTDAGLGLANTPVRITAVEEDGGGLLAVTAEEFPGVAATAPAYTVAGATNSPIDRTVTPAPVNPPLLLEPPSDLTGGATQVWIGASGGSGGIADPNWGGAFVYASTDNATYTRIGSITAPARQGTLTAALAAPAAAQPTDILAVNLLESGGIIASVGSSPLLCVVDAEIISFTSATLTGPNAYALGGLQRSVYGMQGAAHAVGAPFVLLDAAVFKYGLPETYIGQTLWVKLASFNVFGGAGQDLSTCTAYPITPVGSGLFGPVAQQIAVGASMDDGLASAAVGESDSYGLASDPYTDALDLGLASEAATALAVQSGGTGGTSAAAARQSIGAAASGANADITSLSTLTAATIGKVNPGDTGALSYLSSGTARASAGLLASDRYRVSVSVAGTSFAQALDIDPATGHVGLAGYTADSSNALGVLGTACLFAAATDSMRFTFSKVASGNDATLSFQTSFSTRALLGTTGSDQFQLKVSPDGSTYYQVFVSDQTTGNVAFKALLGLATYAVASLPAAAFNGALAFATNGRKLGEAAGAGTGVVAAYSNGQWRRLSDDTVVAS